MTVFYSLCRDHHEITAEKKEKQEKRRKKKEKKRNKKEKEKQRKKCLNFNWKKFKKSSFFWKKKVELEKNTELMTTYDKLSWPTGCFPKFYFSRIFWNSCNFLNFSYCFNSLNFFHLVPNLCKLITREKRKREKKKKQRKKRNKEKKTHWKKRKEPKLREKRKHKNDKKIF